MARNLAGEEVRSRADLPKREGTLWEVTPRNVYYREGTKVYATVYDKNGRREFVCRCATVGWANHVINCLTMPEMM
jgi:hypothetical protein